MTTALNLLIRVIRRRIARDEELPTVLADYPKLTDQERAEVQAAMRADK